MFGIATMFSIALINVEARAAKEGRAATPEEYDTELTKMWDIWINASVTRDMAAAGFIKSDTGEWKSPRRGFWARLF